MRSRLGRLPARARVSLPDAVEDAWAAVRWVGGRVEEIAGVQVPLIVAGEGAGGNLAAVVARRSFERKGPAIALQVLICPVTDSDLDGLSYTDPPTSCCSIGPE